MYMNFYRKICKCHNKSTSFQSQACHEIVNTIHYFMLMATSRQGVREQRGDLTKVLHTALITF